MQSHESIIAPVKPVMKDEARDDRNSTADAISSGRALRAIGCFTAVEASNAARMMPFSSASVSAHWHGFGADIARSPAPPTCPG